MKDQDVCLRFHVLKVTRFAILITDISRYILLFLLFLSPHDFHFLILIRTSYICKRIKFSLIKNLIKNDSIDEFLNAVFGEGAIEFLSSNEKFRQRKFQFLFYLMHCDDLRVTYFRSIEYPVHLYIRNRISL